MPRTGRPREFNRRDALLAAMNVFWERGYDGSSITELATAMGINKPSLYAAFRDKQSLFAEALALYEAVEGEPISRKLRQARTAREAIEATLRHNARSYVKSGHPRGCMIVLSLQAAAPENDPVRQLLVNSRIAGEDELRQRIERGKIDGDVAVDTDAGPLAAFYTAVMQGMSVKARDGATLKELNDIVTVAMASWPSK